MVPFVGVDLFNFKGAPENRWYCWSWYEYGKYPHYLQGFIHVRWLALGFLNHQQDHIHQTIQPKQLLELLLYFLHWKYWSCSHNLRGLVVEVLSNLVKKFSQIFRLKSSENDDSNARKKYEGPPQ